MTQDNSVKSRHVQALERLKKKWPAMAYPANAPRRFNDRWGCNPPILFYPGRRRFPAPPSQDPMALFKPMINLDDIVPAVRWVRLDPTGGTNHAVLFFVDGAASNNGKPGVRAGCGVVLGPDPDQKEVSFVLEKEPGQELTSNRAELRAATLALIMRGWANEGFETIVIGTDSEYVTKGANEWAIKWKSNGWKTASGKDVKNKDLWISLLGEIDQFEMNGIAVQFYLMNRRFNKADAAAKRAAGSGIGARKDRTNDGLRNINTNHTSRCPHCGAESSSQKFEGVASSLF